MIIVFFLCLFAHVSLLSAEMHNQPSDFVLVQQGTIPIILTAPHGGSLKIPNVPVRKKATKGKDLNTFELTQALSKAIEEKTGEKPYIVAAHFKRVYIDANRPADTAYEVSAAKPYYDYYHEQITKFVANIKQLFPNQNPLLIDIHGQGREKDLVFRGTCDKQTVQQLLKSAGEDALTGPFSIAGVMSAQGIAVFPPISKPDQPEYASYIGGFTVRTYGSHTDLGINAIQLEFGSSYRNSEMIATTSQKVAQAIITFCERWQS
ncbi:MAG TPA: hypothetical protein VFF04_02565 [Candidatus Babeliales bacterium]|nr:hypothetical protein [Candidatus Babeliales bacterium]